MYDTIEDKLAYLVNTKDLIKNAIVNQGQTITNNTPFREYANLITNITPTSNLEPVIQNQSNLISNLYDEINILQNTVNNKSVEYDWQSIGYESAPTELNYYLNYSKNLYATWNNNITNMSKAFYESADIMFFPNVNTSKVTNISQCFYNCYALVNMPSIPLDAVTNMYQTFARCQSVMDFPSLNTQNVSNFYESLRGCIAIKNIPNWKVTNKATNITNMFAYCYNLMNCSNCSTWDISNIKSTYNLFSSCYNLTNITSITSWNGANITNVSGMFYRCNKLSNESIDSIVNFLLNCPNVIYKTLKINNAYSPFASTNIVNIRYQNRWTELTAAGWSY